MPNRTGWPGEYKFLCIMDMLRLSQGAKTSPECRTPPENSEKINKLVTFIGTLRNQLGLSFSEYFCPTTVGLDQALIQ